MAIRPVSQEHHSGCFIASVAMLLGKSYSEAFSLLHPGQNPRLLLEHGFRLSTPKKTAHSLLRGLGFKTHSSKYRQFTSYQKWITKNGIMIIRWDWDPTLCHCIVFDGETKDFIEPDGGYVITNQNTLKRLQRQLECSIIVDQTPSYCWIRK